MRDLPVAPTPSTTPTWIDEEAAAEIAAVLAEVGKSIVYTIVSGNDYDPATGETATGTTSTYSLKSIPPFEYEQKYIDGDIVRAGDMLTGIEGDGLLFTPAPGVLITFDSMTWTVVSVQRYYSGEDVALYMLQLRRR